MEKITERFPHPTLTKIVGMPTFENLQHLRSQLSANAASIDSTLGNGQLGLLGLTITAAKYLLLSNGEAWTLPDKPDINPTIDIVNSTAIQISETNRQHKILQDQWKEVNACDKALKKQLVEAVDNLYLRGLADDTLGYAQVTTLEMITNLVDKYTTITPAILAENYMAMRAEYNPDTPMEHLFKQIEDGRDLVDAGDVPYTEPQLVAITYPLIFAMGQYTEVCRGWRMKERDDRRSWTIFKEWFGAAYLDKLNEPPTATDQGYRAASAVIQDMQEAVNGDQNKVSQLINLVTDLQKQVQQMSIGKGMKHKMQTQNQEV